MPRNQNDKASALIIGILFVLGFAIIVARTLFPFFLILTLLGLIVLITVLIIDVVNDNFNSSDTPISFYILIVFFVLLAGMFSTWAIGFEEEMSDAFNEAIDEVVKVNCQVFDETNCKILQQAVEAGKTLQEIENLVLDLKKAQGLIS